MLFFSIFTQVSVFPPPVPSLPQANTNQSCNECNILEEQILKKQTYPPEEPKKGRKILSLLLLK